MNKESVQEHRLGLDTMFVGEDVLVHAGSAREGSRLHGVFVPNTEMEVNSNDKQTFFKMMTTILVFINKW